MQISDRYMLETENAQTGSVRIFTLNCNQSFMFIVPWLSVFYSPIW